MVKSKGKSVGREADGRVRGDDNGKERLAKNAKKPYLFILLKTGREAIMFLCLTPNTPKRTHTSSEKLNLQYH
jgi:hypothetical protein